MASHDQAAQLPVPGTPPVARSPAQGSWDPGWPPTAQGATHGSPPGKRMRPLGVPAPGIAVSAEDVHRILTQLVEGFNHQHGRLDDLERESKLIGDALGTVGRHCQATTAELRGQLASTSSDLCKAMQAVDAALRATIEATQEKFANFNVMRRS